MKNKHKHRFIESSSSVLDLKTRLLWFRSNQLIKRSWEDAKDYCESIGKGWRLPTTEELKSLIDEALIAKSMENPAIHKKVSSLMITTSSVYWSSELDDDLAIGVDFFDGWTGVFSPVNTFYVLPVKDQPEKGSED